MKKEELVKLGLTEELAETVAAASAEELKGFAPRARLDEVTERTKALTADLEARDKQIADLRKVDPDKLTERINELQEENRIKDDERKAADEAHKAELAALAKDNAIEGALRDAGALHIGAAKALIKAEAITFGEDGTLAGLTEQLDALKSGDATSFMFSEPQPPKLEGLTPSESKDGAPATTKNLKTMSYKEILELKNSQPEAYSALESGS